MRSSKATLRDPQRVELGIAAPAETVAHALYPVPHHLKTALLTALLRQTATESVLIFTRTKHRANRVTDQLTRAGFSAAVLHANKSQNQRQRALDDFRCGQVRLLVATDIAARGIDVSSISHVVNYDIPDCADAYIHRIGRTGRAERSRRGADLRHHGRWLVFARYRTHAGRTHRHAYAEHLRLSTTRTARTDEFHRPPQSPRRPAAPAVAVSAQRTAAAKRTPDASNTNTRNLVSARPRNKNERPAWAPKRKG